MQDKQTAPFVFGMHAVLEAVRAGKEIDKIFLKREIRRETVVELYDALKQRPYVPVQKVPVEKLNRITGKNHQGIIAFLSPIPFLDVSEVVAQVFDRGEDPFFVALDGVTDVRNFGAIARTCECAGVNGLLIPAHGAAAVGPDAIKTSSGALHRLPVCRATSLAEALSYLKQCGLRIVAVTEKTSKKYFEANLQGPLCFVMGSEGAGISPEVMKLCDERVAIPMMGEIASLNVSVAAGVLIYEAVKQKQTAE